jgi:hypothetical protein
MRSSLPLFLLTMVTQIVSTNSHAQGLTAVEPIPGFVCMNLAISHEQVVDRSFFVPVYSAPSPTATQVGTSSIIPFIKEPFQPREAYQQMLTLGGQLVWIETKWLKPWSSPSNPKATCTPWLMSNGRPGPKVDSNR